MGSKLIYFVWTQKYGDSPHEKATKPIAKCFHNRKNVICVKLNWMMQHAQTCYYITKDKKQNMEILDRIPKIVRK